MTEADLIFAWGRAFALTAAVELTVAVPALRRTRASRWRRLVTVFIAQLATHPIVWFVIPALHLPRPLFVAVAELWAFSIEALLYYVALPPLDWRSAALISGAANGASFAIGLSLRALTGRV